MNKNTLCPCHSTLAYSDCCEPFHTGKALPANALALMRSRYSAYARANVSYIIKTTHPTNSLFTQPKRQMKLDILQFCKTTKFVGLEIISFLDGPTEAFVTFHAHLLQGDHNCSFQEKSRFTKENGRWFYLKGEVFS
jgi:SEC-C motif domain protein